MTDPVVTPAELDISDSELEAFAAEWETTPAADVSEGTAGLDVAAASPVGALRGLVRSAVAAVAPKPVTAADLAVFVQVLMRLATGPYGYGQDDRWTHRNRNGKMGVAGLATSGDGDCSSTTGTAYALAGIIPASLLSGTWYTGNGIAKLRSTGRFEIVRVVGWSVSKLVAYSRPGDSIWGVGHVVGVVDNDGGVVSFEATESGGRAGGKTGDQTGREGRVRKLHARSRGWAYLARPVVQVRAINTVWSTLNCLDPNITQARIKGGPAKRWPFDDVRRSALLRVLQDQPLAGAYLLTEAPAETVRAVRHGMPGGVARWGGKRAGNWALVYDRLIWSCAESTVQRPAHGLLAMLRHRKTGRKYSVCVYHLPPNSTTSEAQQRRILLGFVSSLSKLPGVRIIAGDGADKTEWFGSSYKDGREFADVSPDRNAKTWQDRAITDRLGTLTKYPRLSALSYQVATLPASTLASDHRRATVTYRETY